MSFQGDFSRISGFSRLRLGGGILLGLLVAGCHGPDHQDVFRAPTGIGMAYMPDTVGQAYVPSTNGEPNTAVAYERPQTPSYHDRRLDENMSSSIELADYVAALRQAGLMPWMGSSGPVTVFAIPNKAMESLSGRWPGGLMAAGGQGQLARVLGYTIVRGQWDEAAIRRAIGKVHGRAIGLKTLYGDVLSVQINPQTNEIFLNNAAGQVNRLWGHSFPQSNGVLYFTQGALVPVVQAPPMPVVKGQSWFHWPFRRR